MAPISLTLVTYLPLQATVEDILFYRRKSCIGEILN